MSKQEPWKLEKDERDEALRRLRGYLHDQFGDEEWGDLAVTMLLDTFEEQVAPLYYNRGITTAQHAMRELADGFEVNTDTLKRQLPPTAR